MTKLEKLYDFIRTSEDLNIPLDPKALKAVDELEEKIIKDEILPALSEQVAPLLTPIQRDLVLLVEYHPGEDISVALSRKVKVAEMLEAKTISLDDTPSDSDDGTSKKQKRSSKTKLRVSLKDGTFIEERFACDTFVEAVRKAVETVGIDEVMKLNLKINYKPLISLDDKFELIIQKQSSNYQLKGILEYISKELDLDWTVEMVEVVR